MLYAWLCMLFTCSIMTMVLVHSLYQLIQTNLTWAAQCWTILGQTNVFKWFSAQDINTDYLLHDITWMVTEGPPLVALHLHSWSRTGQLCCMWNSQLVHLRVFSNPLNMLTCVFPCLLMFAPRCDFGCSGGGHMISMKARRETTVTTSNRFQQSGRWSANFSIKPLLISIIL